MDASRQNRQTEIFSKFSKTEHGCRTWVKVDPNNSGSQYGKITLFVTGNADNIQKLVRGANNYRVKVWFNHLRLKGYAISVDVMRIDIVA